MLACLGNKELSGSVTNTRLAVRKNRGGQQGQEFPFVLTRRSRRRSRTRMASPITTMVVDWQPAARLELMHSRILGPNAGARISARPCCGLSGC